MKVMYFAIVDGLNMGPLPTESFTTPGEAEDAALEIMQQIGRSGCTFYVYATGERIHVYKKWVID